MSSGTQTRKGARAAWISVAAIAGVVALLIALFFLAGDRLDLLSGPPVEKLSIDRVRLPEPGRIVLSVTNDGQEPVTVSQVLVDEAYWQFQAEPSATIPRLGSGRIIIPYPWVEAEAHAVTLISELGATFEAEIPVAVESPGPSPGAFARFGMVGLYVGVLPVLLGVLLYPALRRLGARGINFILALTIGLLLFLAVDTWLDAVETASELPAFWQGVPLVVFIALVSFAVLLGASSTRLASGGALSVAYMIALGIGLHNLGEGLAIGSAYALGSISLGRFLILGFAVHNVTEGIGIAAPLLRRDAPHLGHFVLLVLLAGLPAVAGTWLGGFTYDPVLATVFLAIGVGAIVQVIWSVGKLLVRSAAPAESERRDAPSPGAAATRIFNAVNLAGVFAGVAIMYLTGFLAQA